MLYVTNQIKRNTETIIKMPNVQKILIFDQTQR